MLIALLLFLVGLVLIVWNLSLLGKGLGTVAGIGSMKACPDCQSKIPFAAAVCRFCNYRYPQR